MPSLKINGGRTSFAEFVVHENPLTVRLFVRLAGCLNSCTGQPSSPLLSSMTTTPTTGSSRQENGLLASLEIGEGRMQGLSTDSPSPSYLSPGLEKSSIF
jgi:hypothetical protein